MNILVEIMLLLFLFCWISVYFVISILVNDINAMQLRVIDVNVTCTSSAPKVVKMCFDIGAI